MQRWTKQVAVLALLIAVMGFVTPDACSDEILSEASGMAVSAPTTRGGAFGCQNEEDCFCCAQFAPVRQYTVAAILAIIDVENPSAPRCALEGIVSIPYRPPRA